MLQIVAQATPKADPGVGPTSVVINTLWIVFALVMLGVAFYFFRKWDRRARNSSHGSMMTRPPAPGTVNMQPPSEPSEMDASPTPTREAEYAEAPNGTPRR